MSLSVVMSCYYRDDADKFCEAFTSIYHQSCPPDEVVIVVDGPISQELENAVTKIEENVFVSVVRLPVNLGLGAARNRAIEECSSDYVAVMDADDVSVYDRFETQLAAFNECDADIIGGYIREFSDSHEAVRKVPLEHYEIFSQGRNRSPFNHVSVMFKREVYFEVGGYRPIRGVEDYDLWHRMLVNGCRGHNIPKVLVDVRFGVNDIGRRRGLRYLKCWLSLLWDMYQSGYIGLVRLLGLGFFHSVTRLSPSRLVIVYYILLRSWSPKR